LRNSRFERFEVPAGMAGLIALGDCCSTWLLN